MTESVDRQRMEIWSGRRRFTGPPEFARWFLLIFLAAVAIMLLSGCATTTVRTVTTDKAGTVTETVTTTRITDPAAYALAGAVVTAYAPPRARIVRQEKSATVPGDIRRILRSRPITRQEIAARWRPVEP